MENKSFNKLVKTVKKLREPINGCPWDLKQNIKSLAPSLLEECCEFIDGVNNNDIDNAKEELGDIFFTTALISYIIEQENNGSIDEILDNVTDKMIFRHPHVFTDGKKLKNSKEVLEQWEEIKIKKEGRIQKGLLSKIPRSIPPLEKSYEIQKKVEKVGFDWKSVDDVFKKIVEETNEVKDELKSGNRDNLEQEIGDLLFSVVNLSRFLNIDPSVALNRTNKKFIDRFHKVETKMKDNNLELNKNNFEIMDKYWEESK